MKQVLRITASQTIRPDNHQPEISRHLGASCRRTSQEKVRVHEWAALSFYAPGEGLDGKARIIKSVKLGWVVDEEMEPNMLLSNGFLKYHLKTTTKSRMHAQSRRRENPKVLYGDAKDEKKPSLKRSGRNVFVHDI
ncbi:hypothetical protein F4819DRAFT_447442 [Hypoxylon fuscum]|nr:hypothetical protein F4819DRAFT_447442 [Hypoxylon fuscum]